MKLLAMPYGQMSVPLPDRAGEPAWEVVAPAAFAACLASGSLVPLVRGHNRGGRSKRRWIIDRVKCFEEPTGLYFDFDGTLPDNFSGFSIRFKPRRWKRIGPQTYRLTEAKLRHIALLVKPDVPAYPSTFTYARNLLCPIQRS